jgi:Flp pilus assembly pilin Flp
VGKMSYDSDGPGGGLCCGLFMIIAGALFITKDDWIGWILLPCGIVICIMSINWALRGPKKYTDEDLDRAKTALDRMCREERGATKFERPAVRVFTGIVMIILSTYSLITDSGGHRYFFGLLIAWLLLLGGIYVCIDAIRSLLRGEGKAKISHAETARVKKAMDRIDSEEHGATKTGLSGAKFLAIACIALTLSVIGFQIAAYLASK